MRDDGEVIDALREDPRLAEWLRALEADDLPDLEFELPGADALPEVLVDLAVPHELVNELVALRGELLRNAEARALMERVARSVAGRIGTVGLPLTAPALPPSWGALGRYFYVFVYVAVLPYTREFHRAHDIPADVARRTLADIGRNVAVYRRTFGVGGMHAPWWPILHLRGELYHLGRLHFQRARLDNRTGAAVSAAGLPHGPGSPTLSLHIPDFYGPLGPAACDRALELARDFFPRHFPGERYAIAGCQSWLLDPQLKRYLPPDSNIIRFQERFHRAHDSPQDYDEGTIGFVFGREGAPLDELPRDSVLQRAIVDHIRSGGHWHVGSGWFEL